jgi:hypothetical protein
LILNGTHQLSVCADGVNILGGTVRATGKKGSSLVAINVIGLEANADKIKCMVMSRDLNAGRSYNIKPDNSSSGRMEGFKSLTIKVLFKKK